MFSFIHKNCHCALSWSRRFLRRDAPAAGNRVGIAARLVALAAFAKRFAVAAALAAAFLVVPAHSACVAPVPVTNQMAVLSPCSPSLVTANQITAPALTNIAVDDVAMQMQEIGNLIKIQAPGMTNAQVWTHNQVLNLTPRANGVFTGNLNLSMEPDGPLAVRILASNAPSGGTPTVSLAASMILFVNGPNDVKIPFPVGAAEMSLIWSDEFDALTALPCKPGTGTWPNCQMPTASDCPAGVTACWYENKPDGGDFGDAAFEHTDNPARNPFTIVKPAYRGTASFLRIRSTYDLAYVDPYGYHRHWYSGLLANAFRSNGVGSQATPPLGDGYYEARILVPYASTGQNIPASGGTWPAWWMLDMNNICNCLNIGRLEIDTAEQYGVDESVENATEHAYNPATGQGPIYNGRPLGTTDLSWGFHRYGMLIRSTGSNPTVALYFDDQLLGSKIPAQLRGNPPVTWFLLVNLAMGGFWPDNPPPASYYDYYIDYVRAYR